MGKFILVIDGKFFREAKISNFHFTIVDQDVFGLQISMNDFPSMALSYAFKYLFKHWNGLVFRDFFWQFDFVHQWTLVAKLNHHDFDVLVLEALKTFEDVGTVNFHHQFWLFLNEAFPDRLDFGTCWFFDRSNIEHLDGNLFSGFAIHASVNLGKRSFSDLLENVILVKFPVFKVFFSFFKIGIGEIQMFVSFWELVVLHANQICLILIILIFMIDSFYI